MGRFTCRWYCWLPALLVAAGLGYVGYRAALPWWTHTEAWQKFQRVRLGMTPDEVKAVLGDPAGGGTAYYDYDTFSGIAGWSRGHEHIRVFFLGNEVHRKSVVIQGYEFSDPPLERNWWERVRARLGG
jgi:hypothetical protein